MAWTTKAKLSGSTDGRQIKVVATATPGTAIHTAQASATLYDEIYLFATNRHTGIVTLTVEFGGVTSPDDLISMDLLPNKGYTLVVPGLLVRNSLVVRAFASVANVIMINGYIHQET